MKRALTLAAGLTIGYVAGARAGREKYDQIKDKVHEVSQQPAVTEMRENIQGQVGTATKAVAEKVTDVASGLAKKVHASSDGDSASGHQTGHQNGAKPAPGEYPTAPTGVIPGTGV
jgi:uncharacterized protein with von Willebrand factor type A (vWA) domain